MSDPSDKPGTPQEKRVPLRQFTNRPRPSHSEVLADRLRTFAWYCFPILIMVFVAAVSVIGFRYYDEKNKVPVDPDQQRLDLLAEDASAQLLDRYLKKKGGPPALELLESKENRFYGLITIDQARYLFESHIVRSKSATITFISEGRTYEYEIVNGLPKPVTESTSLLRSRLEQISLFLTELLAGYLSPMHAVIIEPETYQIQQLERTRLGGLPVLAVTISNPAQPTRTAIAYLDEATMHTIATETRLSSNHTRHYKLIYHGHNDETTLFPDEIQFSPLPDENWEILINRGSQNDPE